MSCDPRSCLRKPCSGHSHLWGEGNSSLTRCYYGEKAGEWSGWGQTVVVAVQEVSGHHKGFMAACLGVLRGRWCADRQPRP